MQRRAVRSRGRDPATDPAGAPDESGAVSAELALGAPLLLALTWALAWVLVVGVSQVRTVDAAREAARALARGDPPAAALAMARQIAPAGARVTVSRAGTRVRVVVRARIAAPGGSLAAGMAVQLQSEAVALVETDAAAGAGAPSGGTGP